MALDTLQQALAAVRAKHTPIIVAAMNAFNNAQQSLNAAKAEAESEERAVRDWFAAKDKKVEIDAIVANPPPIILDAR